jgi:hypothetical protein
VLQLPLSRAMLFFINNRSIQLNNTNIAAYADCSTNKQEKPMSANIYTYIYIITVYNVAVMINLENQNKRLIY